MCMIPDLVCLLLWGQIPAESLVVLNYVIIIQALIKANRAPAPGHFLVRFCTGRKLLSLGGIIETNYN